MEKYDVLVKEIRDRVPVEMCIRDRGTAEPQELMRQLRI